MTTQPILKSRTPRVREPICPPWCEGHDEHYQDWEDAGDHWFREHSKDFDLELASDDTMGISLDAQETKGVGGLKRPRIGVYVGSDDATLTLEALQLARLLIETVEQATEWKS